VVYIYIGKQKVVWIPKLRENGWEAAASALSLYIWLFVLCQISLTRSSLTRVRNKIK
jgi:hypothetical protein